MGADLGISFGSDDANPDVDADGALADRSVTFAAGLVAPLGLTSNGVPVSYSFNGDRTVLTAEAGTTDVFTVSLSTHSQGGVTDNDLRLAAEVDRRA